SERAGANFVTLDPHNPRVVYVCFWDAQRGPYYLDSGGPGSGIYKSTDGGDSWERLDDKPGMPDGNKGKMEVAVSAREGRIWAIVESQPEEKKNGIYRSEDGGQSWQHLTSDTNLTGRPWYFNHIRADPRDADTLWVLNFEIWRSVDGGSNYQVMAGPHADYHDLWIDPDNTQRLILGGDGGACVSLNGAESWSTIYNQPTSEFYHATTDNRFPYRVYGAQQDNTSMSVPSRSDNDAITLTEWYEIGGGESGYIAVRPDNPDIILAGAQSGMLTRYDHERKQELDIAVWPESARGYGSENYRFRTNWTSPMVHSPHDPNVVYYGSHVVHRSTSDGRAWDVISSDLTRADPETLHASGGDITKDNSGAEVYATVFTIAPSTLDANVIWTGSDDGLVHVTRDGGATWDDATPSMIPDWALMSIIEASPHDAGTAYLAATRYKSDDFQPYLYRTSDYGKSWTKITNGIPTDDFTRVIREDPARKGLLYAGTETGIYVSLDDGGNWHKLGGNLPVVPIHDLIVKDDELLICTHGRAFWIMDDLTLVRQLAESGTAPKPVYLFQPKDAIRSKKLTGFGNTEVKGKNYIFVSGIVQTYVSKKDQFGNPRRRFLDAGQNPDDGAVIYYWLADKPAGEIGLTILDSAGNEARSLKGTTENGAEDKDDKTPKIPAIAGLNRFVWDMRVAEATKLEAKGGDQPATTGPRVVPGDYMLRLTVGGETFEQPLRIVPDPRHQTTAEELQEQHDLLLQIRDKLSETNDAINRVRRVREQVDGWVERAKGSTSETSLADAAKSLKSKLAAAEEQLIQVKANSPKDTLHYPVMLNGKLVRVANAVASADMAPTRQARDVVADLSARIDTQIAAINTAIEKDVPAFNKLVAEANLDAIVIGGK
ncbi:MAG: glycosyl hydrolase, partial [Thermomicrobiales bacterium]